MQENTIAIGQSSNKLGTLHPTLLRNDGTPAFSQEHKKAQYDSFFAEGEAGDDHYEAHGKLLRQWLDSQAAKDGTEVLSRAGSSITFEQFLAEIPEDRRPAYNCNCCSDWFRRNATTVVVSEDGTTRSLFWNPETAPAVLKKAYALAKSSVEEALAMGFYSTTPETHGRKLAGVVDMNGKPEDTKMFAHYHNAGITEKIADPGFRADVRLNELIAGLQNADRTLTNGADLIKAILEVESNDPKVLGHIRMLKAYLEISRVTGRARAGISSRDKAWNASFFQLANVTVLNNFSGSAIGTAFFTLLAGEKMADVLQAYFKHIDPTKYKRKTAEVANGRLIQAEKFFAEAGYGNSLNLVKANRNDLVDAAERADRLLWTDNSVKAPVKEVVDGGDTLFGHLRKEVRDEKAAAKVAKPVFATETISLRAFMKNWLKKAVKISVVNPSKDGNSVERLGMSLTSVRLGRQRLATMLAACLKSPEGEGTQPIYRHDVAQLAAQGERWPYITYNLDARIEPYIQKLGTFWRGLGQDQFDVSEVMINRFEYKEDGGYAEDRDTIHSLMFIVPSVTPLITTHDMELPTAVRATYFPNSLRSELQPYRDVMEQYIADRGFGDVEEGKEDFTSFIISADPNITIMVEMTDGIQPLVIATVE